MTSFNLPREAVILERFLELMKSPYGDFPAISRLSHVLNDRKTLQRMVVYLSLSPQGKQAFEDRPLLGKVDLQKLENLPSHTLGHLYAQHMISNRLTPVIIEKIPSSHHAYLLAHLGETHDIWHVVTGSDTDKPGEIQLEAFLVAQLAHDRLHLALLAKNLLKTAMYDVELCEQIMDGLMQGWVMGKRANPLFGIQWNRLWATPLKEIQSSLKIATTHKR